MNVESVHNRALALVDCLVDHGPQTKDEVCKRLDITVSQFTSALRYARIEVLPDLGIAIPFPIPDDDYRYQVTMEWEPVARGAAFALGMIETRMRSVHVEVVTIKPHLTRGTKEWRRANLLDKHLTNLLGRLREINEDGQG